MQRLLNVILMRHLALHENANFTRRLTLQDMTRACLANAVSRKNPQPEPPTGQLLTDMKFSITRSN
jgi:hypothetical protein